MRSTQETRVYRWILDGECCTYVKITVKILTL